MQRVERAVAAEGLSLKAACLKYGDIDYPCFLRWRARKRRQGQKTAKGPERTQRDPVAPLLDVDTTEALAQGPALIRRAVRKLTENVMAIMAGDDRETVDGKLEPWDPRLAKEAGSALAQVVDRLPRILTIYEATEEPEVGTADADEAIMGDLLELPLAMLQEAAERKAAMKGPRLVEG